MKEKLLNNLSILGLSLSNDLTIEMIKSQYKKLALKYHPDMHVSDGSSCDDLKQKFILITDAYKFLTANFESLNTLKILNLKQNSYRITHFNIFDIGIVER